MLDPMTFKWRLNLSGSWYEAIQWGVGKKKRACALRDANIE